MFTQLTNLYDKDGVHVENLKDKKGRYAFAVLTTFGAFIVHAKNWDAFISAGNDFESKAAVSHKAFKTLKRASAYHKRYIAPGMEA